MATQQELDAITMQLDGLEAGLREVKAEAEADGTIDDEEREEIAWMQQAIASAKQQRDKLKATLAASDTDTPWCETDDAGSGTPKPTTENGQANHSAKSDGGGTIRGSVGKGGGNDPADVKIVQQLLAQAGYDLGTCGPNGKGVDGDCGKKTAAAISNFQQSRFGWQDGLVKPGGQTWQALDGQVSSVLANAGHTDNDFPSDATATPSLDIGSKSDAVEVSAWSAQVSDEFAVKYNVLIEEAVALLSAVAGNVDRGAVEPETYNALNARFVSMQSAFMNAHAELATFHPQEAAVKADAFLSRVNKLVDDFSDVARFGAPPSGPADGSGSGGAADQGPGGADTPSGGGADGPSATLHISVVDANSTPVPGASISFHPLSPHSGDALDAPAGIADSEQSIQTLPLTDALTDGLGKAKVEGVFANLAVRASYRVPAGEVYQSQQVIAVVPITGGIVEIQLVIGNDFNIVSVLKIIEHGLQESQKLVFDAAECNNVVSDELRNAYSEKRAKAIEKLDRIGDLVTSGVFRKDVHHRLLEQLGPLDDEAINLLTEIGCVDNAVAHGVANDFLDKFDRYLDKFDDVIFEEFIAIVDRARQKNSVVDEKVLTDMLDTLSPRRIKQLEKEVLLWDKVLNGNQRKIRHLVTDFLQKDLTDAQKAEMGKYSLADGQTVKDGLDQAVQDFVKPDPIPGDPDNMDEGFTRCLDFLFSESLDELYADDEADEVAAAKVEYGRGVEQRKKGLHKDGTLTRLASELRTKGLAGPVNHLKWKSTSDGGHHEPHPADLFDRLSSAGDGWYFFLVSLFSFHTFIVAVEVERGNHTYFEIQGGQSVKKSREKLKDWFDDEFDPFPHSRSVGSKVWPVYPKPRDL